MDMKLTRRGLAAVLAGSATLAAQIPAPTPQDALQTARERIEDNARQLAKVPLPMATGPAFHFKA
ncbi:MAG TPA: hypothetical protein VKV15_14255 [Bryobacteraceae bacterium]|nr:hypothetical protein [Bryobacteraceae bacterium]